MNTAKTTKAKKEHTMDEILRAALDLLENEITTKEDVAD
jgi:hypothetical protein